MNDVKKTIPEQIHRDRETFHRMVNDFNANYGPESTNTREFHMACRAIDKMIAAHYKGKLLEERTTLRQLSLQNRRMLRQMYPHPLMRLARNIIAFAFQLLKFTARIGYGALKGAAGSLRTSFPANTLQNAGINDLPAAYNIAGDVLQEQKAELKVEPSLNGKPVVRKMSNTKPRIQKTQKTAKIRR